MDEVDLDDLAGACAKGLHDGDGVQPLLEVGAHGHGDADGPEDKGDEGHEGEQAGGLVEAGGEGGVGLAVVGDLGLREELDEAGFEVGDGGVRDGSAVGGERHFEEVTLAGVAAGSKKAGVPPDLGGR